MVQKKVKAHRKKVNKLARLNPHAIRSMEIVVAVSIEGSY
jgi:hypothetical protein